MADHLREAVFHAFVAALMAQAALRLWKTDAPALTLELRLFSVAAPCLLLPAFELLAPFRHAPWFVDRSALFSGARWSALRVAELDLGTAFLAGLSALGVILLARDLVPWLRERRAQLAGVAVPCPANLEAVVDELAKGLGLARPPRVVVVEQPVTLVFCGGVRRPQVVVSTAALEQLDSRELRAALAHELAHLRHHDVLLGWVLLAARVTQAFNPVVQVLARAIALDAERRADDVAARLTGEPVALASALLKTFKATRARSSTSEVLLGAAVERAREAAIEERCRRLLNLGPPVDHVTDRVRLAAAVAGIGGVLFFVT